MALSNIPQPSTNAFKGGALDNAYLKQIVDRLNALNNVTIKDSAGNTLGTFILSDTNIVITINTNSC